MPGAGAGPPGDLGVGVKRAQNLSVVRRSGPRRAGPRLPDFGAVGLPALDARLPAEATVADLIEDYLAAAEFQRLAPGTQRDYRRGLLRLGAVFGATRPRDWQGPWGQHYLRAGAAPVRANRDVAVLSILFRRAVAGGLIQANPIRELRRNPERPRSRYVSDAELSLFLSRCDARLQSYVRVKLATGLRQGQLLRLRWEDWDGAELRAPLAKGGRPTIYRGGGLPAALEAARVAWRSGPRGPLFPAPLGPERPITGDALRRRWARAMRRHLDAVAGGDPAAREAARFREHDLRAKVATDSGDVAIAQARLGHATPTITSRVYMRGPRRVEAAPAPPMQRELF